ncbi:hypothetical protein N0V94_000747 [Neodidymelliopsis sp. IMI 364377]|nr:hypothetical protein N0V94_000747 [Neodidymelliopsis sp. IMI 364377]
MERFERHGNKGTNIPLAGTRGYNASFVVYNLPYANIRNYVGMVQNDNKGERTDAAPVRTYMTANTTIEVNRTISFKNMDTLLMAFIVMRASDDWLGSQIPWEASTPTATECALYLCANAYEAKSENSLVEERLVGSWAYKAPGSYQVNWDSDEWNLSPGAEGYVASLGTKLYDAKIGRTDLQLLIPEFSSTAFPAHLPRAFNVSHAFIFSAIDFLIDFSQSNEQPIGLPAGSRNGTPVDETWDMLGVPWTNDQMPPVVDALWNSTNLTATFENVARSLTNQIRNASPDRHQGELQQWVMHVRVDWAYLAYPIAMLVAGIVYVVLTIIESTRLRMPVWKESALPTLLHGFDDESQRLLRKDGKAAQRKTRVRFERDGEGRLRLVTV